MGTLMVSMVILDCIIGKVVVIYGDLNKGFTRGRFWTNELVTKVNFCSWCELGGVSKNCENWKVRYFGI